MLEVDPIDASGLVKALNGGWYYPTGSDGRVSRDKPKKPNHPHEDHGDALCYLLSGMAPLKIEVKRDPRTQYAEVPRTAWDHVGQERVAEVGKPW